MKTMYPRFGGIGFARVNPIETASSKAVKGLGDCRMGNTM